MSDSLPRTDLPLAPPPKHYFCPKAKGPVRLSGRIDDPAWELAEWTDDFTDILGADAPTPPYRTRVKMLWDDLYLYIAAELEDPHVWATLTEHDSIIFHDNDFEVFIDPDGDCSLYAELEINALNTTWDLLLTKPYRARGKAINGWEIKGLQTVVHIDGTINDPSDEDRGWSVEIGIPWVALNELAENDLPPDIGHHIRLNFSRVQWQHEIVDGQYRKVAGKREDNWVWSPQGVVDMHRPHRWGIVTFYEGEKPEEEKSLASDAATLSALFEAQHAYRISHHQWAKTTDELGIPMCDGLVIETTSTLLEMRLGEWAIDGDSRLRHLSA